jgi:hypothetical protein
MTVSNAIELKVEEMLDECKGIVRERGKVHGAIDKTFLAIAALWSVRAGVEIKPSDVCDMLEDLKWVRSKENPGHHDNSLDGVNYKVIAYALRECGT